MRIPYDPARNLIGGDFAWAQDPYVQAIEDSYNAGKPVRVIVLKARQLGFSTITEGVIFNWMFLHPGTHGLCLANETDTSEELFAKTKTFWETWPFKAHYNLKYATKNNMHWLETGSQLKIATAGNRMSGRGHTLHAVHLSEVAFYPDPKTLMLGLQQSVPEKHGTIMVLESTANGIGNYFYNMWSEATEGGSDYTPLFFPWWKHPEYRKLTTLSSVLELSAEEKTLLKMMRNVGYLDDRTFQHLHWRRWMLKNKVADLDQFMQEYPSTPEEAFRTSGTPVFPHGKVAECFHDRDNCPCHGGSVGYLVENVTEGTVRFYKDRGGPVTIFKHPSRRDRSPFRYFLGADPAETVYGDLASIQVINRATNEQVACYSSRVDPRQLAAEIIKMGRYYNHCMVCPEAEGGGQACIATVLERNYPLVWLHTWADKAPGKKSTSYGWSMNYNRKKWAVGHTQHLFLNDEILIHDAQTYHQLLDYAHWGDGLDMGNASPDGHDDAVMALCIAVTASHTEPPYLPDQLRSSNPVLDIYTPDNLAMDAV
jgi:hypothetical protein